MSNAFANEHQDNYFDGEESNVAAFTSQSKLALTAGPHDLAYDSRMHPGGAFPFSGDHLGTFAHRETTPEGDPGEEIRRERIHTSNIDLWTMVAA